MIINWFMIMPNTEGSGLYLKKKKKLQKCFQNIKNHKTTSKVVKRSDWG